MAEKSIEDRVREIIVNQLNVNEEQVTAEASFLNDLGADSLDTVELIMAFEEEFKDEIKGEIPESGDRGDIDNSAPSGGGHGTEETFGPVESAGEVGSDDVVPFLEGHPEHEVIAGNTGVIDENIDFFMGFEDIFASGGNFCSGSDVDFDSGGLKALFNDLVGYLFASRRLTDTDDVDTGLC